MIVIIMLTPMAWASRDATTMIIPDDGDLEISWKARTDADGVRLRLYTVDSSGSKALLTEKEARRGIGTYHYVDHRSRNGRQIQYRLCVVTSDGRESTLAVVNCSEPDMNESGTIAASVSMVAIGLAVSTDQNHEIASRGVIGSQAHLDRGTRPRPPVPPPRLSTATNRSILRL